MPKLETYASLYLPTSEEKDGKVIESVRKNGDTCKKTANPEIRYFETEHKNQWEITPKAINIVGNFNNPLQIAINDDTGVEISSYKKIILRAKDDISLYTPKSIRIKATSQIIVSRSKKSNGFTVESEFHFLSENVLLRGRDATTFAKFDDAPKEVEPPGFSWGKLFKNVGKALLVVAAATAAVALTASTFGAGAAVVGAVVKF
ncbi:hypothetical protein, partial [Dethiothermospora halolimnae]|uniref:hypothetical protein n=1 Tax=Dethiothermospora halolimnae TaxID=3114390 RepID=UPI003CCC09A3